MLRRLLPMKCQKRLRNKTVKKNPNISKGAVGIFSLITAKFYFMTTLCGFSIPLSVFILKK
jgi:hypothetical protein